MGKWLSKKLMLWFALPSAILTAGLLVLIVIMGVLVAAQTAAIKNEQDSQGGGCQVADSTSLVDKDFNADAYHKAWSSFSGGVLADQEAYTIQAAKKSGVSAVLMAAIMANESGWGKSSAARNQNNPSGQMNAGGIISYSSIQAGIDATAATLNNLVVQRHLDTVDKLGGVYCPVGASNDPTGINKNWVPAVTATIKTFMGQGGSGLLVLGGSQSCNSGVGVTGEKMSYFDKAFAVGKEQLGKPYVLGAGMSGTPTSFDCGSFTLWVLQQAGVHVTFTRIAQNQYNNTARVDQKDAKAGDLVFFKHTYDTGRGEEITHVGMYIGDNKFIGASGDQVQISNLGDAYWQQHLGGFGRIN